MSKNRAKSERIGFLLKNVISDQMTVTLRKHKSTHNSLREYLMITQ